MELPAAVQSSNSFDQLLKFVFLRFILFTLTISKADNFDINTTLLI